MHLCDVNYCNVKIVNHVFLLDFASISNKLSISCQIRFLLIFSWVKVGSSTSKKKFICLNHSPSKMMKNAFYFILKALFVLKIFKFLSWLFGHLEKTPWLESKVIFEMYDATAWLTKNCNTHIPQYLTN